MASKVRVLTYQFIAAHGRLPRGEGYWAFSLGDRTAEATSPAVFTASGKYSEAKRLAVAEARRRGVADVYVMS